VAMVTEIIQKLVSDFPEIHRVSNIAVGY